jgi:Spy/CpxP family protein refolding chaperone
MKTAILTLTTLALMASTATAATFDDNKPLSSGWDATADPLDSNSREMERQQQRMDDLHRQQEAVRIEQRNDYIRENNIGTSNNNWQK